MEKQKLATRGHSLTYNSVMNLIYSCSKIIFPLITAPYLSRILGAESTGRVDFIFSVTNYFVLIAGLGIPTYGIKACAETNGDKEELTKVVHELLFINAIALIISLCLYLLCISIIPKLYDELPIAVIGIFLIISKTFSIDWFYQGIEQYDYIVKRTLLLRCITLLFIVLAISSPDDYILYALSSVLAETGISIFNFCNLRHHICLFAVGKYSFRKHFKPVMTFFIASIAVSIYNQVDVTMIGWIDGALETGFYEYGIKPVKIIWTVLIGLTTVALPRIVSYAGQWEKERKLRIDLVQYIFIISVALTCYFYSVSNEVILFLFGKDYSSSADVFKIFVVSIVPVAFSNFFINVILLPHGGENKRTVSVFVGLIVDIILNALLIPQFGATGAAFSTLCTEIIVCLCLAYFSRDAMRDIAAEISCTKKAMFLFGCFVLSLFIKKIQIANILFKISFGAFIFLVGCLSIFYLINERIIVEQIRKMLKKLMKRT